MTELAMDFVRDDPRSLQTRLATFVAGRMTTKQLAKLLGCDIRTAENIRRGHWPQARHFKAILQAFRRDVIDAVITPEIDEAEARLEARERHAYQIYLAAKAEREAAAYAPERDPQPLLPFEELDR